MRIMGINSFNNSNTNRSNQNSDKQSFGQLYFHAKPRDCKQALLERISRVQTHNPEIIERLRLLIHASNTSLKSVETDGHSIVDVIDENKTKLVKPAELWTFFGSELTYLKNLIKGLELTVEGTPTQSAEIPSIEELILNCPWIKRERYCKDEIIYPSKPKPTP